MVCLSYFSPVTFSVNVGNRKVNNILVNIELEDKAILEQYYHTTNKVTITTYTFQINLYQKTDNIYVSLLVGLLQKSNNQSSSILSGMNTTFLTPPSEFRLSKRPLLLSSIPAPVLNEPSSLA